MSQQTAYSKIKKGLLFGILIIGALLILCRLFLMTSPARSLVENYVEQQSFSGQIVTIEGFQGDLLNHPQITRLTVSDQEGVWLEAKDVSLKWHARSLFRKHLNADYIKAAHIKVIRQPQIIESEKTSSPKKSNTSFSGTIKEIAVPRIEIKEAFYGVSQTLSLKGRGQVGQADSSIQLAFIPTDHKNDKLETNLQWSVNKGLNGYVTATGPANGLFAKLLGTDQAPSLDFRATNQDMAFGIDAKLTAGSDVILEAKGELSKETTSLKASFDPKPLQNMAIIEDRFGSPLVLNIDRQPAEKMRAKIYSDFIDINALLPINLDNGLPLIDQSSFSIETLHLSKLLNSDAISTKQITLTGRLKKTDSVLQSDAMLTIENLKTSTLSAGRTAGPIMASYDLSKRQIRLTSPKEIRMENVTFDDSALSGLIGSSPSVLFDSKFDLAENQLIIANLQIDVAAGQASAKGSFLSDLSVLDITGGLNLSLDGVALPMGVKQSSLEWQINKAIQNPISFSVNGFADGTGMGELLSGPWTEGRLKIDLAGKVENQSVRLDTGRIKGPGVDLTATGSIEPSWRDLRLKGFLSAGQIASLSFEDLNLNGTLQGTAEETVLQAAISAPSSQVADRELGEITLDLDGQLLQNDGTPQISASLMAKASNFEGAQLTLSTDVQSEAGIYRARNIDLNWDDFYQLTGAVAANPNNLMDLQGDLNLQTNGQTSSTRPDLNGLVSLKGEAITGNIDISNLTQDQFSLEQSKITLSGTREDGQFELTSNGSLKIADIRHPFRQKLNAGLSLTQGMAEIVTEGSLADIPFKTASPININFQNGIEAAGQMNISDGDVKFDYQQTDQIANGLLQWTNIAAADIGKLVSRPQLRGKSSGQIDFAKKTNFKATLQGSIDGLTTIDNEEISTDLRLFGDVTDTNAVFSIASLQDSDLGLDMEAKLPLTRAAEATWPSLDPNAPIIMTTNAQGEIAGLWAYIAPPTMFLQGNINMDLRVAGPLDDLKPEGRFELENALFEDETLGIGFKNISVSADLYPQRISISALKARGIKGGQVSGKGDYDFRGLSNVEITLDDLQALTREDIRAKLSGTLSLSEQENQANLAGALTINEARINLDELPRSGYVTMDVQFKDDFEEREEQETPAIPLKLAIDVKADRRIFVSGSGLDTEWGADFLIGGTAAAPEVTGASNIIRGDVDLIGKKFIFSESKIEFSGDPTEAQINIVARRNVDDFTALVTVTGDVTAPEIGFSADNNIPQDEVLSRVLFGQSPSQLSGLQAAQLAAAVASLSGGQSFNLMGSLQNALGVDRLDFATNEEGAATLSTGKYLTEDVYLEVRSGLGGAPGVGVEWTPRDNIQVGTAFRPIEGPRFTVEWKRDFDAKNTNRESDVSTK